MSANDTPHPVSAGAPTHGSPGTWSFGLFECFAPTDTCSSACFCPCMMYGKIYDKINHDDASFNGINGQCCLWMLLCPTGLDPVLSFRNRRALREKYGIDGSASHDCAIACCCACAAMVQEHNEIVVRTTGVNPKTNQPYASPSQMSHA